MTTTVEDYIEVWKSFGLNSVKDYHSKVHELYKNDDFCEKFKTVNYKNFWLAAHQHFGTDPIANHDSVLRGLNTKLDLQIIEDANKSNWSIANASGVSGLFDNFFDNYSRNSRILYKKAQICELGSGYGSLFTYLNSKDPERKLYDYQGFDLISRFDEVEEVSGEDGCLSEEQVSSYENKFNMVYSFNVFQHLEKHQIQKYIDQTYRILNKNEFCSFILGVSLDINTFHYGQVINLPNFQELFDMLGGRFVANSCFRSYVKNQLNLHLFQFDLKI